MTAEELADVLDGLYARVYGCVDSGIRVAGGISKRPREIWGKA